MDNDLMNGRRPLAVVTVLCSFAALCSFAVLVGFAMIRSSPAAASPRTAALSPHAATPAPRVPRFESTSCTAWMTAKALTRCGFLVVPENRARGNRKTIRVAVAIVRATAKKPASGPLVYLGGGPGGAPILQAAQYVANGFNAARDLILVDQRGTYYSKPALTCPELDRFFQQLLGLRGAPRAIAAGTGTAWRTAATSR